MKLTYDWSKYPNIALFLLKIYCNTTNILKMSKKDENYANIFINDIEAYFWYLKNNGYDLNVIYERLKSLLYIDLFKGDEANIISGDKCFSINENIQTDGALTARENQRLYLYQGLSELVFDYNNEKTSEFSKTFIDEDDMYRRYIINRGWKLISDTLSQVLANEITYNLAGKSMESDNVSYEKLLILFASTISGVGNIDDYSETKIIDDLLKKALTSDLSDQVISEYIYKGNEQELITILYNMGLLKSIKNLNLKPTMIKKAYENVVNTSQKLFNLDDDIYEDIPIVNKQKKRQ